MYMYVRRVLRKPTSEEVLHHNNSFLSCYCSLVSLFCSLFSLKPTYILLLQAFLNLFERVARYYYMALLGVGYRACTVSLYRPKLTSLLLSKWKSTTARSIQATCIASYIPRCAFYDNLLVIYDTTPKSKN